MLQSEVRLCMTWLHLYHGTWNNACAFWLVASVRGMLHGTGALHSCDTHQLAI